MAHYDDVTLSSYRDVSDDVTSGLASESDETTAACLLYKFVVDSVNGLVCVLGFIGNIIAFVVFHWDSMKTSTSFLFQVVDLFVIFVGRKQRRVYLRATVKLNDYIH